MKRGHKGHLDFLSGHLVTERRKPRNRIAWAAAREDLYANLFVQEATSSRDCAALFPVIERPLSTVAPLQTLFRCLSEPPMPKPS